MALKVNGVTVVSDTRDLTLTSNTTMTRATGNVVVTLTGLAGSGYAVAGNKVFTAAGSAFANVVFDNGAFLDWPTPYTPQMGTISGYTSGGLTNVPATARVNTIDKFPFASDTSAGDVGDLTVVRECPSGQSSSTFGYSSAGSTPPAVDTIDKYPFSSDTNATDVGELIRATGTSSGQSSQTFGYDSGGDDTINKFPFAVDSPATDVGNLLAATSFLRSGHSSSECGYTSGGFNAPVAIDTIQKFSFKSDGNSVDVGEITDGRYSAAGQSSQTHGYTSGGQPVTVDTIDKFPFSSDASSIDVGELTTALSVATGQNSTVSGYTSGGNLVDTIQKFPFSSDTSASDVGELTQVRRGSAGQQSGGNSGI